MYFYQFFGAVLSLSVCLASQAADVVQQGSGAWRTQVSSADNPVPSAPFRTPAMMERAAPTNQWYSSVMFTRWSEVLHAVPLTAKASPQGLEVGFPQKTVVPTERKDVEILYPHKADITLRPLGFQPQAALLAGHSDWAVDIAFEAEKNTMLITVAHGSPFVYAQLTHGDLSLDLASTLTGRLWPADVRVLLIRDTVKTFAAFAPTGAQWVQTGSSWQLRLTAERRYASLAILPNDQEGTIREFLAQAYSHIVDTRAEYRVDSQKSEVVTSFKVKTRTFEGPEGTGVVGLYPHHWHQNLALPQKALGSLGSIRGDIRFFASSSFETRYRHTGFVPYWPGVQDPAQSKAILGNLSKETRRARRMMLEIGQGPYWQGKGLQRISQLMSVADAQGDLKTRDELLALVKGRFEEWLSGQSKRTYFHYSPTLGTVVSYPEEYDAVKDMNDHHFHYGYWIRAAADIGLRDPQWIKPERWGGMIDQLVADIATAERGRKDFPYLRNFDPYEGHSWASGVALSPDGNNQESSSEAINAWAGLMLWGALQGRPELVELGTYLYTTEIQAINHYWFDIHGLTLPKEYQNAEVSMLFGGKLAHNTWWIDEPRQIHGINLLPLTASSTYLAASPAFTKKNMTALDKEIEIYQSRGKRAKPEDIWQDLFAKYVALVDPKKGLSRWNEWGSVELGDTRTHAQHWLYFLNEVGPPDLSITANTKFYASFKSSHANSSHTYMVYNPTKLVIDIRFSNGYEMKAQPMTLTVSP
jgi:endoglucanase Acf2